MIGIYRIINPKGKIYIGQSIDLEKRNHTYSLKRCKSQRKIYNSIKKYGWKNHKFKILLECEKHELNKYERALGLKYNVLSTYNLNLQLPSSDDASGLISDETREKMKIAQSGNNNPMFGKNHSIESKRKIAQKNSRNKKIKNIETQEIYYSISELSRTLKIPRTTLERKLNKGFEKYILI